MALYKYAPFPFPFPGPVRLGNDTVRRCVAEGLRRARETESRRLSDRHASTAGRSRSGVGKKKLSSAGNWDRAIARASTKLHKASKK